ncbi:hypothetical protein Sjap_015471 [Stephania japonica]|uniref:Uncharacterized protein n=1 Tax=Stephania japonica TaxID=461633 RepID=A0AAP0IJ65_9MAGN
MAAMARDGPEETPVVTKIEFLPHILGMCVLGVSGSIRYLRPVSLLCQAVLVP